MSKFLKRLNRCWDGYEPVPGKEPYSPGSCRPKMNSAHKSDPIEQADEEKPKSFFDRLKDATKDLR